MTATNSGQLPLTIAERVLDPSTVVDGMSPAACGSMSGLAGTALLHARLSAVDECFAAAAVAHWNLAAAHTRRSRSPGNGTFTGPGAVATSLIIGSPYLPDPDRTHAQCAAAARWLATHALALADQHHDRLKSGEAPASWAVYDVICGLAGTGRALMAAADQGHQHARAGLDAALRTLTAMINRRTGNRPGWWLPAEHHPTPSAADPSGAAATGLAHGIAGPLSLLALATKAGYVVPGQEEAISTAAHWLLRWREPTNTWPPHVTGRELDARVPTPGPGRRDAWCYGTPGIAAALAQAADILGDDRIRGVADHAMQTLTMRDPETWDVEGPTLCHGYAGNLQAARDHANLARAAAAQIEAMADTGRRYLIQHRERGTVEDDPGLLTGAAGVALALADFAGLPAPAVSAAQWDSILLLS